jgi:hypothetical protein
MSTTTRKPFGDSSLIGARKIAGGSGDENINVFELRTGGFERPADGCEIPHIGGNSHDFIVRRRKRTDSRVDVFLLATRNRHLCAVPGEGSSDAEIEFPWCRQKTKTCLLAKSSVSTTSPFPS